MTQSSHSVHPGSAGRAAIQIASSEKTNARSLLPIGPSYRRGAPTITATTPVISEIAERKMTAATLHQ